MCYCWVAPEMQLYWSFVARSYFWLSQWLCGAWERDQLLSQFSCWGALILQPAHLREIWLVNYTWLVKFFAATHFFEGTRGPFVVWRQSLPVKQNLPWWGICYRWTSTGMWYKLIRKTWGNATALQASGMFCSHSYKAVGISHLKVEPLNLNAMAHQGLVCGHEV